MTTVALEAAAELTEEERRGDGYIEGFGMGVLRWIRGILAIREGLAYHFGEAYRGAGRAMP